MPPLNNNHYIIVGSFGTVYGIKGWIRVNSFTDPPDNFIQYKKWFLQINDEWRPIEIENLKMQANTLLVKIKNCDTPEDARFYTRKKIAIERHQLPPLPENEYYWEDLIGLSVKNTDNYSLGSVIEILTTGANDIFVIQDSHGKRHLIPYTHQAVKSIDLDNQIMIVEWDPDF